MNNLIMKQNKNNFKLNKKMKMILKNHKIKDNLIKYSQIIK